MRRRGHGPWADSGFDADCDVTQLDDEFRRIHAYRRGPALWASEGRSTYAGSWHRDDGDDGAAAPAREGGRMGGADFHGVHKCGETQVPPRRSGTSSPARDSVRHCLRTRSTTGLRAAVDKPAVHWSLGSAGAPRPKAWSEQHESQPCGAGDAPLAPSARPTARLLPE